MKKQVTVALAGLGSRGKDTYAPAAKLFPDRMKIVAIADIDPAKVKEVADAYDVPDESCFTSAEEMISQPKLADVMFITTQDQQHVGQAIKAMEKGYDLLMEKPISPDLNECREIIRVAKKLNRTVVICHVLRYTPFYQEVKRILKSGKIGLPFEAAEAGRIPGEKEAQLRKLFEEDEPSFYQALQKEKTEYQTALYLYMKWGAESYPSYKEAGISDRIYYDTFRDMEIWYRHCLKETGIPGMKQYQWTSLPIKRKIYRLGRLQYEPSRLKDENWEEGKEIPVLEVHIPEGEPLDVQAVKDSFKEVAGFFEEVVSYKYDGFHCESWLLSPQLHNLLSKQSNILRFQDLFFVYNEIPARQAEERVFGKVTDRIEEYPEDTSLQRALKAYLQKGNKVGMGCGFIPPEGPD